MYTLILVLSFYSNSVTSQNLGTYSTLAFCNQTGQDLKKSQELSSYDVHYVCVRKYSYND